MLHPTAGLLAAKNPIDHVVDYAIVQTSSGWWLLSNHMIMMGLSALLMLLIFPAITRRYRSGEMVPTGTRNFFEAILLFVRDDVAKPLLGEHTTRFIPYLWTLFFFIWFTNLLGLLPLDVITGKGLGLNHGHGIFGTATANIAVTGTLALIAFLVIQISGLRANGVGGWAKHFLGGAPWYMAPVMIPVELLGMIIKPCALAIRLAANMNAGHILLAVIIGFVPLAWTAMGTGGGLGIGVISVIGALAIMVLELFVATLQAYLFTFLTALFISQMVVHEHDDHSEHADHGEHPASEHGHAAKPAGAH